MLGVPASQKWGDMSIRRRLHAGGAALACVLGVMVQSGIATAGTATTARPLAAATGAPVSVVPSKGLAGGDSVLVTAAGVTPLAQVQVTQCDTYAGDPEQDCSPGITTTAGSGGNVSVTVTLTDPVFRNEPFGDPTPVYCRADVCRIFLAWIDQDGNPQVVASDPLTFTGSPATITARKVTALRDGQKIRVHGTAYGARGHRVEILEEACFSIVQGSGCYGQLREVRGTVDQTGHYAVSYRVHRFLADGTDCADPGILGFCEMNVIVFTHGQPDDSFGVSRRGQPALPLTFTAPPRHP